MKKLGSELVLGILVVTLSILATVASYISSDISGKGDSHTAAARQYLADANKEDGVAMQLIVLDYTMFDGFYINDGRDNDVADYYHSNFSQPLLDSIDRDAAFDDQYYDDMYAYADENANQADEEFAQADAFYAKSAGLGLISLLSAIGLSSAAYASLLKEGNRLRLIFALIAALMLVSVVIQFLRVFVF